MNRQLAEKLLEDTKQKVVLPLFLKIHSLTFSLPPSSISQAGVDLSNPLGDDRFAAMFSNPDFQVDEESEVWTACHDERSFISL